MTRLATGAPVAAAALAPILPDLFEALEGKPGHHGLVGSRCAHCERHFFPMQQRCPACHSDLQRCVFGEFGSIYSYTVVRTKAPFSLPEPYALGYVDLADVKLRVFALLDPAAVGQLAVGAPVVLMALPLGADAAGTPCMRPVFCLSPAASTTEPA